MTPRRGAAVLAGFAAFFAALACNQILGNALDPSPSGEPGDSSVVDGADASVDGADGSGPLDSPSGEGASDAPPTDGPPLGFCASQTPAPDFCSDFDTNPPPPYGWTNTSTSSGGQLTVGTVAASPPYALVATTQAVPVVEAVVYEDLNSPSNPTGESHLAFKLWLDAADPTIGRSVADLEFGAGPYITRYVFSLRLQQGGGTLVQGYPTDAGRVYPEQVMSQGLAPQTWTQINLDVVMGGSPTVTLRLDGSLVASMPIDPSFQTFTNGPVRVSMGVNSNGSQTTQMVGVRIDNLTLTLK